MKIGDYRRQKANSPILLIPFFLFVGSSLLLIFWQVWGQSWLEKSSLEILTTRSESYISIDSQKREKTPWKNEDLKSGDHLVKVWSDDPFYAVWTRNFPATLGTNNQIVRELGPSDNFSSGKLVYYEEGSTAVSITTSPDQVSVLSNGKDMGTAPLFLPEMAGGDYNFSFMKEGYESQSFSVRVENGYVLHISVDLFQIPIPPEPALLRKNDLVDTPVLTYISREGWQVDESLSFRDEDDFAPVYKVELYDLSSSDQYLYTNSKNWVKGIYYYDIVYNKRSDVSWHYFIDREGTIYEGKGGGSEVVIPGLEPGVVRVGYLGKTGEELTNEAILSFGKMLNVDVEAQKYQALIEGESEKSLALEAGKEAEVAVTYKNTGEGTWYDKAPKQVYLKSKNEKSLFSNPSSWIDQSKVSLLPVSHVGRDQEVQFTYSVLAPNQDGELAEEFALWIDVNGKAMEIAGSTFTVKLQVTGGVKPMVLIKETGTGYLNVRDKAGFGGIVDRVTPGEKYVLVEETSGWVKIKVNNTVEGWVSSDYVEKVN